MTEKDGTGVTRGERVESRLTRTTTRLRTRSGDAPGEDCPDQEQAGREEKRRTGKLPPGLRPDEVGKDLREESRTD